MNEYDVLIIGGGITGAGVARDCALRGLKTLLIERSDIADGASGRNHGLLHSGARYAVSDIIGAKECIVENRILRRIARGCIEPTEGLFISLPEDSLDYQSTFVASCRRAGIEAYPISPEEAIQEEPLLNPAITGAVRVPDASVDPFRLVAANVSDAKRHGADICTRCIVTGFIKQGNTVMGVEVYDGTIGQQRRFYARYIINAAGIWGAHIAEMAGVKIAMFPAKGSLLVFEHRMTKRVINRCRKPGDGDIVVPGDVVSVLGTTSTRIPFSECDDMRVTRDEVNVLLSEGVKLMPCLAASRILRAYAGVRPLVADDNDPTGRNISRGIVLLDHAKRDDLHGLITITGGKLTTYRLMAEMTTDLVCQKLSVYRPCQTALLPLPGSEVIREQHDVSVTKRAAFARHGAVAEMFDSNSEVLCHCEMVTRDEIEYAVRELGVRDMNDLRRRTRIGMGTCQGGFCMQKVAETLAAALGTPERADELKRQYLEQRWKGITPVLWGDELREAEYIRKMHVL